MSDQRCSSRPINLNRCLSNCWHPEGRCSGFDQRDTGMSWVTTSVLVLAMCASAVESKAAERPVPNQKAAAFVREIGNGWHLRGDIRFSPVAGSVSPGMPAPAVDRGFDAAPFYLLGERNHFEGWLRSEAQSQPRVNFHGLTASVSGETLSSSVADNSR